MNYAITYFNDFSEPYLYQKNGKQCRHINYDQYIVQSIEDIKDAAKDFLDVPTAELSKEEILKDFSSDRYPLSEEKAVAIVNYYNGRLTIWRKLCEDLSKVKNGDEVVLHYPIPQEYNEFTVADGEPPTHQNNAYIAIQSTETPIDVEQ